MLKMHVALLSRDKQKTLLKTGLCGVPHLSRVRTTVSVLETGNKLRGIHQNIPQKRHKIHQRIYEITRFIKWVEAQQTL